MKKTNIALAVLSMAAFLVSCQDILVSGDTYIPEKGEIVFRLADGATTRAEKNATVKGVTLDLGTHNGTSLYLEETVTRLDQVANAPITRGTPAYTENFATLYGDFKAAAFKSNSGTFESSAFDDGVFERVGESGIWKRKYGNLGNSLPLYFFLRAPYDNESTTAGTGKVSGLTYNTGSGAISFSYTSPATAAEQKDLLFTSRKVTSDEYADLQNKGKGVPVLFHHALTGVKFAIANPDGGFNDGKTHSIAITKVEFSGLVNSGLCVITPRKENGGYEDVIGDHSSGGTNKTTVWTLGTGTGTFSQEFTADDLTTYEQGTGKSFTNNGEYPKSFADAGNENNVNDGNASKTFWFIPQTMNDNVILTISYQIDGVDRAPVSVDFGKALKKNDKYVTWEAGELRTYTLRIDDVKVHIADNVSTENNTKDDIVITNTGNTDAFIRATIIGNWCDPDGAAVFGYTDFVNNPGEYVEIPSWTIENPGTGASFVDLPGTGWVRGNDGYFYYTTAVAPHNATGSALFTSYTAPATAPTFQIAGKDIDSHFVMEIATQAISAKKQNGGNYNTWADAWTDALGYDPSPSTN